MRIVTYTYPDGTKSIRRPRDGEMFRVWDQVDQNEVIWQWDGYKEHWYRTKTVQVPTAMDFIQVNITIEADKCECGSEKTGSNRHSSWCKKWNAEQ